MRFCLSLLVVVAFVSASCAQERKLNVLFLMADDMRPELGCYGHASVKSPNIDGLAKAGVRFDRAYCQYPLCNPSRTSMLTGRYPTTTGVLENQTWFGAAHPDWVSLPRHFKDCGYASLRAGKIFHGGIDDDAAWTEGGEARKFAGAKAPVAKPAKDSKGQSDRIVVLDGAGETHNDYRVAERAIEFLRKYKDKPFFLACGFTKPHSPPTAPKKFFDLYDATKIALPKDFAARPTVPVGFPERCLTTNSDLFIGRDAGEDEARRVIQAYWASLSFTDWNVGRVLAELDKQGLRDNTIVIFWGDHGYHLGEKGKWSKHGSLFEVGTRVPLIVCVPKSKHAGNMTTKPVQALDIYSTLCELCGLKAPAGLEGHSLKPLLDDPKARWDHAAMSVAGNLKRLGVAVRTETHRYVEYDGGAAGVMLFDETADPNEAKNLADDPKYAKVRAEMATRAKGLPGR